MSDAGLNREQKRAIHALTTWQAARAADWPEANYRTLVNGFGAQVLRSGLLAAVAFARRYVDKKAAEHMLIALFHERVMSVPKARVAPNGLIAALAGLDAADYMLATREVLAATLWLRRAVQEGDGEGTEGADQTGAAS